MREYNYWIVTTSDGCEHVPVLATSKWHAMKIIEERNFYRVKAESARRA